MAQTGYTPIILFHSTTASAVPTTSNLAVGELGLNNTDGKLYYNTGSAIAVLAGAGGAGIAGGSNTQVQYNSSGSLAGSANMVFDGTKLTVAGLKDSALTNGRVTYATTSGELTDSANLQFNGTSLSIGGSSTAAATGYTFVNAIGSNGGSFELYSGTTRQAQFFCDSGTTYIGSLANIPFTFKTNNSEKMRIDTTGNVGIGTASPSNYAGFVSLSIDNSSGGSLLDFLSSGTRRLSIFANTNEFGIYGVSSLPMNFYTNSTERMRIDSSGNVGIGTSSSVNGLSVYKSGTQWTGNTTNSYPVPAGNVFFQTNTVASAANWIGTVGTYGATSGSSNLLLQVNLNNTSQQAGNYIGSEATSATSADLTFGKMISGATTGGNSAKSEQMRIDSSGNVGIGTTATSTNRLSVVSSSNQGIIGLYNTAAAGASGFSALRLGSSSGTDNWQVQYNSSDNSLNFYDFTAGTTRMNIDSSGNVGIGTSSPGSRLAMFGATGSTNGIQFYASGWSSIGRLGNNGTSGGDLILSENWNASANTVDSAGNATAYVNISATSGSIMFGTGNTGVVPAERMRITSAGNLLVGTTSPISSERLNVTSTGTIAGWFQTTNSATSGIVGIYSVIPSTAFNTNCTHFSGQTSGINTWFLYGNGTTSYVSDVNLKKNIVTTRDGYLDDLAKLRVVKYQWKINSDNSPTELGFIAQEVAEVFPALVKDSIPAKEGDPTNKVILGSVLQPILIKSVQELYALVQEQQTLINNLTTRLNALEGK